MVGGRSRGDESPLSLLVVLPFEPTRDERGGCEQVWRFTPPLPRSTWGREGRAPMITITNEWKREGDGESAFVALERAVDEGRPVLGFHAS